jgi:hypothetical protein
MRGRARATAGRDVTVFYDRQSVLVTDQTFAIGVDVYAVDAIDGVLVNPRRVGRMLRFGAFMVPVPLAAVGFAGAVGAIPALTAAVLAGALFILALIVAAVAHNRGAQRHELWISYDSGLRKVLETHEEWRVRQLARALRRAIDSTAVRAVGR